MRRSLVVKSVRVLRTTVPLVLHIGPTLSELRMTSKCVLVDLDVGNRLKEGAVLVHRRGRRKRSRRRRCGSRS
jgi:hypothetical protein